MNFGMAGFIFYIQIWLNLWQIWTNLSKSFSNLFLSPQHVTNEPSTGLQFKCSYCPKMLGDKITLRTHERAHRGEKNFACSLCASSCFASKMGLAQHMRGVHKEPGPRGGHTGWYRKGKGGGSELQWTLNKKWHSMFKSNPRVVGSLKSKNDRSNPKNIWN